MAKKRQSGRMKLPKRVAGVKIPKQTRRNANQLLKDLPRPAARSLLAAAIGTLVATLVAELEHVLHEAIEAKLASARVRTGEKTRPIAD